MELYVLTLEWNEGEFTTPYFPLYNVTKYGKISTNKADNLRKEMEKNSPYDHCDMDTFATEEEYNEHLRYMERNGAKINH